MADHVANIPFPGGYLPVLVDMAETHHRRGWLHANLFAVKAHPGRVWEFHALLFLPEGGAVYRDLPLHALAHGPDAEPNWQPQDAQTWDCYGRQFTSIVYEYLAGLRCKVRTSGGEHFGHYVFTIAPYGDAFSNDPGQAKEFYLCALDNGRFTLQPTNHILIEERSHTETLGSAWPSGLKRKTTIHSCE